MSTFLCAFGAELLTSLPQRPLFAVLPLCPENVSDALDVVTLVMSTVADQMPFASNTLMRSIVQWYTMWFAETPQVRGCHHNSGTQGHPDWFAYLMRPVPCTVLQGTQLIGEPKKDC
jgi:hypothetical protein